MPIVLFFSSRQISAHSIRNFCSNQSIPGRFDNIEIAINGMQHYLDRVKRIWYSRQILRCSLIQAVNQEETLDRKPDLWPLWMAGHAQLKFVMTECLKTQIRLTGLIFFCTNYLFQCALIRDSINVLMFWRLLCTQCISFKFTGESHYKTQC